MIKFTASFLLLVLQVSQIYGAKGVKKLVPDSCQGQPTKTAAVFAELENCEQHAPPDASNTCIQLCVLHNRGLIANGLKKSGVNAFVEETFPWGAWDALKVELKTCGSQYAEDDDDTTCTKSAPFTTCLEKAVTRVCKVQAAPSAPNVQYPAPAPLPPQQYGGGYAPAGYNTGRNGGGSLAPPPPPPPSGGSSPCIVGMLGLCLNDKGFSFQGKK